MGRQRPALSRDYDSTPLSSEPTEPPRSIPGSGDGAFVESLMDTDLYSMGAYFCDQHPDLVDEVVDRAAEIEGSGLASYAAASSIEVEEAFGMLLTGLSVRYYKAIAG